MKCLPSNVYDILKWVAQILIPALSTLYAALGALWGWPYIEQIVGTLSAVDLFFGALLGISSAAYAKELKEE